MTYLRVRQTFLMSSGTSIADGIDVDDTDDDTEELIITGAKEAYQTLVVQVPGGTADPKVPTPSAEFGHEPSSSKPDLPDQVAADLYPRLRKASSRKAER